jgi:hypothetical protein
LPVVAAEGVEVTEEVEALAEVMVEALAAALATEDSAAGVLAEVTAAGALAE